MIDTKKDAGEYAWDLVIALERDPRAIVPANYKDSDLRDFSIARRGWNIIEKHIRQVIKDYDRKRKDG